mgnify:CR=1 FL=1
MRITIVTEDNIIGIDNTWIKVDCAELIDKNIRVLQWYEDFGVIEDFDMKNYQISSLDEFEELLNKYNINKEEQEIIKLQQQKESEEKALALANKIKGEILELNPTAKFPSDVDTNNDEVASIEELQAYLNYLKQKALISKFEW